jgi:hypothetical protein
MSLPNFSWVISFGQNATHFGHPRKRFPQFWNISFGLGGPSTGLPSFSSLPHLEVGYLFRKRKCIHLLLYIERTDLQVVKLG